MAPSLETVDIPSLAGLAFDLHRSCYLLSGSAPDGFKLLVTELASLQGILQVLRNSFVSNPSYLDELAEDRRVFLQRCCHGCLHTLQQLDELSTKYRHLGVGDGQIWQKVDWNIDQDQVGELRSRVMVHSANLHPYLIPTRSQSRKKLLNVPSPVSANELHGTRASGSSITEAVKNPPGDSAGEGQTPAPAKSETMEYYETPTNFRDSASSDSRPPAYSTESNSNILTNKAIPGLSFRTSSVSSPTPVDTSLVERSTVSSPQLPDGVRQEYFLKSASDSSPRKYDFSAHEVPNSPISQAAANPARPLRYEPRDPAHVPDPTILENFEASANNDEQIQRLNARDWLRLAVWWLLKARTNLANCERPTLVSARGSMSPSTASSNSSHQGYVDLLKASYILYDVVLKRQHPQSLTIDENRKLISDISDGLKEDFSQFISVDIPDTTTINSHNLEIWEPIQPDETSYTNIEVLLSLENVQYSTVELEDAGAEDERVILRTFVNAGIGGKKFRMRTKSAPYMLLLSTIEGESEPKITICNQSGTLCLKRDFTTEDLAQLIRVSNTSLSGVPNARISEPVTLKFDSVPVSISFQYATDLGQFINIPKAYFDAVWQREPVDSEQFSESVIFKSSVDMVEQLRAPIMKSMNPPIITPSCQVRILERTFPEVWRSIRRMVISSSAAEKSPRSLEFFMPMSGVQIQRSKESRSLQIKWSDTGQERSDKTDGSYNPVFSYVYDDSSPNIGLEIRFRTEQGAADFEKTVLSLTHKSTFSWSGQSSSGNVYDVADVAVELKQYKAILLVQSRLSFKYCSLYYLFRDIDYIYDSSNLHVQFPKIFYVDYISSHVDQLYRAANNMQVFFSHCDKKISTAEITFDDETVLHSFMSSLASGYELCFSRRAESMTTKKQSFLGSSKSAKGETEVQLWRKGNSVQLASRWINPTPDRWLTMSVPSGSSRNASRESTRIEFPPTAYTRGMVLNLAVISSGSPKDARMAKRSGPITILFSKAKDREDFIAALDGGSQTRWKYGHGYDLLT
ncbi:hypothetical protein BDV18DRAFT_162984 [Aspergillus unguis]